MTKNVYDEIRERETKGSGNTQIPLLPGIQKKEFSNLTDAVRSGSKEDVRSFLLKQKNISRTSLTRLLCIAASFNPNAEVMGYLIEMGADVYHRDCWTGNTILHKAARSNPHVGVLDYLIKKNINVDAQGKHYQTALHFAAQYNPNIDVLKYLIDIGASKNVYDSSGNVRRYWLC